jgi:hypothetical protein
MSSMVMTALSSMSKGSAIWREEDDDSFSASPQEHVEIFGEIMKIRRQQLLIEAARNFEARICTNQQYS